MADLHPGKRRTFKFSPVKADGSPGELDGGLSFMIEPDEIVAVQLDETGLGGTIHHNGGVGAATITFSGDGDLGEGIFTLTAKVEINALPPLGATGLMVTLGEEEDDTPSVA